MKPTIEAFLMGPVSRVAPFGLRFRRKRKSAIGLRGSAGAKPMVEPMELWQRLGHASYRDWVLAAQRARRVAIAAKKAAAKATMPAVQRQPSSVITFATAAALLASSPWQPGGSHVRR